MTSTDLNPDTIRKLASTAPAGRPTVSLYLDVDGRRWPKYQDCETRAERLVRRALDQASSNGLAVAMDDLQRVETFVKGGVDRSATRGLALFSGGPAFWHVFELPVAVRDQLVVGDGAHVHQLEAVVDANERFGVLLVDKQRARLFVFELGRLIDRTELFDALPRHDDDAGDRDRRHDSHKLDTAVAHHLKHAAKAAFEVHQQHPFDHLIIGAPPEISAALEADLHPYLRDRIAARLHVVIGASEAEIRSHALAVEESVERAKENALVARLRDAAGAGRGGVVGLADTLDALADRRIDTLIVSEGFEEPGWSCVGCARFAIRGPKCAACGASMAKVPDVVETAIELTMREGGKVKVYGGTADLDVLGRVGALLRY